MEAFHYYFNLFLGTVGTAFGLITLFWAPRMGPNSRLGFRHPYTFQSREVWDRVNRAGGLAMAAGGLLLMFITLLLADHGLGQMVITAVAAVVALLLFPLAISGYARRVIRETVFSPRLAGWQRWKAK